MNFLPENIDQYVVNHSQKEPQVLQELSKETWQKVLNQVVNEYGFSVASWMGARDDRANKKISTQTKDS